MLKEICTYIANGTSFTLGTDLIFGHSLVSSPDTCVVVLDSVGGSPEYDLTDYVEKHIQIISRSLSYNTARENALTIYAYLHGKAGETLPVVGTGPTYYANVIEAVQHPYCIGQDEKGRWEFSVNFVFRIQDIS